jgi:RNA polymerase sigma-70 factor (ECF subfamily)
VRLTAQEWRRRFQRSRPVSNALVDQSGLPRARASGQVAVDDWRTRRWDCENEIDRVGDQPLSDIGDAPVSRHLIATALGRLTQEHRDVLAELYFRGNSVAQAAQALGIAPGAVKSRTYYALHALRLAIEELRGIE